MEMGLCMGDDNGDGLGLYIQEDIGKGVERCMGNDNEEEVGLFMGDDGGDGSVYGRWVGTLHAR